METEKPAEKNLYVILHSSQITKPGQGACGDIITVERSPGITTMICCDGMGSGIRANVAARLCVSRIRELLEGGWSVQNVFYRVVKSMNTIRGKSAMYAAFTIVRILANGRYTAFSYEAPPPVVIRHGRAQTMGMRMHPVDDILIGEGSGSLGLGDGIILLSDGVSQAGLGSSRTGEWGSDGLESYINDSMASGIPMGRIPETITAEAFKRWISGGDDISAVLGVCTKAMVVNILTGPCRLPENDKEIVERFKGLKGFKIICGASTAKMVARCTNSILTIKQDEASLIAPPRYDIAGYELVCEGTVTLNQVYNIFDLPPGKDAERSAVTDLRDFLRASDRVNFIIGEASNPTFGDIAFTQQGIRGRREIVGMLAEKLKGAGKLVTLEYV